MVEAAYTSYLWLANNPDKTAEYIGYWVAVLKNKIVASAKTLAALIKKLQENKIDAHKVLIAKIPERQEALGCY